MDQATTQRDRRTAGLTQAVRPIPPFAFAFAISSATAPMATIMPGETLVVDIADGKPRSHDSNDWFASRVPVMPAISGPVHVLGANQGDLLEVEILDLAADVTSLSTPVLMTVAVAGSGVAFTPAIVQAAVPCGGLVRLPSLQAGGMLTFGPSILKSHGRTWRLVSAQAVIRCSVFNTPNH